MHHKSRISIIIAVFNGEKHLEETIKTIIDQTYPNIELIIIDGGSTDGTIEIIKKYQHQIDHWVSEADKGISDAFNKGLKLANGDYINFQGDGDGFYSGKTLEQVFSHVDPEQDIFVSAKIQRIDDDGKELYVSKQPSHFKKTSLLFKMPVPHQGLFTHKSYFKKYGMFDINNVYCMDYEHLLRSYHEFPQILMVNTIVARWRDDGLGNGKELEIFMEYDEIRRANKVASDTVLSFIKYWTLFKYHLKRILK